MSQVPLPFCIIMLIVSILGLAGNIRFFVSNFRESSVYKQLLVLMTALHIVLCVVQFADIVRDLAGFSLTRSLCLRFTGAIYAAFSFAQSMLYSLLGVEIIVLVANVRCTTEIENLVLFSGWGIYRSWGYEGDVPVLLCLPTTALLPYESGIRSTLITSSCFLVIALYLLLLAILVYKRKAQRSRYTTRIIRTTVALTMVFTCSWFIVGFIMSFNEKISQMLNLPIPYLQMTASFLAVATYTQTQYVYFFVVAKNRKALRRRGPIAIFMPVGRRSEESISTVARTGTLCTIH